MPLEDGTGTAASAPATMEPLEFISRFKITLSQALESMSQHRKTPFPPPQQQQQQQLLLLLLHMSLTSLISSIAAGCI